MTEIDDPPKSQKIIKLETHKFLMYCYMLL